MVHSVQGNMNFDLLEAAYSGDVDRAISLLERGVDPAVSDARGNNFLHIARYKNHSDFFDKLTAYLNENVSSGDYESNANLDRRTFSEISLGERLSYELFYTKDDIIKDVDIADIVDVEAIASRLDDQWWKSVRREYDNGEFTTSSNFNNRDTFLHKAARANSFPAMEWAILKDRVDINITSNSFVCRYFEQGITNFGVEKRIEKLLNKFHWIAAGSSYFSVQEESNSAYRFSNVSLSLFYYQCPLTGQTALHRAARKGNMMFIDSILKNHGERLSVNAFFYQKDLEGKTFLEYLNEDDCDWVMRVLPPKEHVPEPIGRAQEQNETRGSRFSLFNIPNIIMGFFQNIQLKLKSLFNLVAGVW
jgi:hypothetical protein